MCLTNVKDVAKIAPEDIVCYKKCNIYRKEKMPWSIRNPFYIKKLYFYRTPYYYMDIELGKTYYSVLEKTCGNIYHGLHSFAEIQQTLYIGQVLIKCIIPKGATYYEGEGLWEPGYASNELKYIKIVKIKPR